MQKCIKTAHSPSKKYKRLNTINIIHENLVILRFKSGTNECCQIHPSRRKRYLPNRRSIGKLEAKIARNYCHQHLVSRHRNNNPEEITEVIFVGSMKKLQETVLAEAGTNRTGEIPDYPRGLVCFDSCNTGFFNQVSVEDEVSL